MPKLLRGHRHVLNDSEPPKRFRWQFSLRSLLMVVTLICVSWGLTASWGVSDVVHDIDTILRSRDSRRLESHEIGRTEWDEAKDELVWNGVNSPEPSWHVIEKPSAPAPFIVAVDVQYMVKHFSGDPQHNFGMGSRVYFFWFLGIKMRLPWNRVYWF